MPDRREKLIELLIDSPSLNALYGDYESFAENADYLIANGVTIQRWIPVTERLPEPGERVVFTDGLWVGEGYINKRGKWQRYLNQSYTDVMALDVTHWMPLPSPPEAPEMDGGGHDV